MIGLYTASVQELTVNWRLISRVFLGALPSPCFAGAFTPPNVGKLVSHEDRETLTNTARLVWGFGLTMYGDGRLLTCSPDRRSLVLVSAPWQSWWDWPGPRPRLGLWWESGERSTLSPPPPANFSSQYLGFNFREIFKRLFYQLLFLYLILTYLDAFSKNSRWIYISLSILLWTKRIVQIMPIYQNKLNFLCNVSNYLPDLQSVCVENRSTLSFLLFSVAKQL